MMSWDELVAAATELGDGAFLATVQADGRPHVAWVSIGHPFMTAIPHTPPSSGARKAEPC